MNGGQHHTQYEYNVRSARLIAMDERAIKRLLVILAVSIVVVFLFKAMMTSTIGNLSKAAAEKKAAARPPVAQPEISAVSDAAIVIVTPAAPPTAGVAMPELSAASSASGAQ